MSSSWRWSFVGDACDAGGQQTAWHSLAWPLTSPSLVFSYCLLCCEVKCAGKWDLTPGGKIRWFVRKISNRVKIEQQGKTEMPRLLWKRHSNPTAISFYLKKRLPIQTKPKNPSVHITLKPVSLYKQNQKSLPLHIILKSVSLYKKKNKNPSHSTLNQKPTHLAQRPEKPQRRI